MIVAPARPFPVSPDRHKKGRPFKGLALGWGVLLLVVPWTASGKDISPALPELMLPQGRDVSPLLLARVESGEGGGREHGSDLPELMLPTGRDVSPLLLARAESGEGGGRDRGSDLPELILPRAWEAPPLLLTRAERGEKRWALKKGKDLSLALPTDPLAGLTLGAAFHRRGNLHTLALAWKEPVQAQVMERKDGLLLTFSRPLGVEHFKGFERPPDWVEGLQAGYDTVLVRPRMEQPAYIVRQEGKRVVVEMLESAVPKRRIYPARRTPEEVRLETIRARQMLETDEEMGALAISQGLLTHHPELLDSALVRPLTEERLGRWRQAVVHYNRLLAHFPDEPDVVRAEALLRQAHASHVRYAQGLDYVNGGEDVRLSTLEGRDHLSSRLDLLWKFQTRRVESDQARQVNGTLAREHSTRERGSLEAVVDHDNRDYSRLGLMWGPRRAGWNAAHAFSDRFGFTALSATWEEPIWDALEGHAGDALRSRTALRRDNTFSERTSGFVEVSENRYAVWGQDRAASSLGVSLGMQYALPWSEPRLTVIGYRMDGEYNSHAMEMVDPNGASYNPYPVITREIHALEVALDGDLTDYLRWELGGGLGIDRLEDGWIHQWRTALVWSPLVDWEISLSMGQGNTSGRQTNARIDRGEVALKMLY